jgi:hypothetical protein
MEAGLWKKRRKKSSHRRWRVRKECFGEMVQMDGSHHDWLEGRGPKLVLMGYIDDATGNVFGDLPPKNWSSLYVKILDFRKGG